MSTTPKTTGDAAVSERFALIRRVADDLAHELKNPLNAVVINLEVLRTRVRAGNSDAALERIDVIEAEVQRLHRLLDQLLRLVRPDAAGLDTFPVDEVLGEVAGIAQVLAKVGRRGFELTEAGDGVYVRGRREELRFAALSLIEAALQAVAEGESVRLRGEASDRQVTLHVEAPAAAEGALREALARVRRSSAPEGLLAGPTGAADRCQISLTLPRGN